MLQSLYREAVTFLLFSILLERNQLQPNLRSLCTILADINVFSGLNDGIAEIAIGRIVPDFPKRNRFQFAHGVLGILVETTRNDIAIPGNYGRMPQSPTMISELVFDFIQPRFRFAVAGVFLVGG